MYGPMTVGVRIVKGCWKLGPQQATCLLVERTISTTNCILQSAFKWRPKWVGEKHQPPNDEAGSQVWLAPNTGMVLKQQNVEFNIGLKQQIWFYSEQIWDVLQNNILSTGTSTTCLYMCTLFIVHIWLIQQPTQFRPWGTNNITSRKSALMDSAAKCTWGSQKYPFANHWVAINEMVYYSNMRGLLCLYLHLHP